MCKRPNSQQGTVLVFVVILLPVIIGFAAMAIDVGYWYLLKAELSKSVDAAALAGARNVAMDPTKLKALITGVGEANFPQGLLGAKDLNFGSVVTDPCKSPVAGEDNGQNANNHTFRVSGCVTAPRFFAYWRNSPVIKESAKAKMRKVEIVLVLDKSGSMTGTRLPALQTAAGNFVAKFANTVTSNAATSDRLGLISFCYATTENDRLNYGANLATTITGHINNIAICGGTNAEDAMTKAANEPFTTGAAAADISQFVIFFTDGQPNSLTSTFVWKGVSYQRMAFYGANSGACADTDPASGGVNSVLPTDVDYLNLDGTPLTAPISPPSSSTKCLTPTGDGILNSTCTYVNATNKSGCEAANPVYSVKWDVFSDPTLGLANYTSYYSNLGTPIDTRCRNTAALQSFLPDYICRVSRDMTIKTAQGIKDKGIKIYGIGLYLAGDLTAEAFIRAVASTDTNSPDKYVFFPTATQLNDVFNKIARDIALSLAE